ncbi:MAG: hypothetical protein BJ554DRAFT_7582 [Olpidium bornovanus]|uniref:Uncharacterized protein n=1 Tax=Olpidium bornovanus TaxID=278681 RepID=A0A8H7ZVW3_9FUNG|nr:MAG: hypothetical protein BJ554DRAFT_7582 [Olpidium bornovanus]
MHDQKDAGPSFTYRPYVPPTPTVHPLRPYAGTGLAGPDRRAPALHHHHHHHHHHPAASAHHFDAAYDDLVEDGARDFDNRAAARELLNYGIAKYFSSALVSPFQVAATLLQVQYLPSNPRAAALAEEVWQGSGGGGGGGSGSGGEPLSYFGDAAAKRAAEPTSEYEEDTLPPYELPPLENGVWDAIGAVGNHPTEGWGSLWKGQFTNWLYQMTQLFMQPTLEGVLNDLFDLYDDTIPLVHLDNVTPNLATLVTSHVVVGWVLSPLELVRTR